MAKPHKHAWQAGLFFQSINRLTDNNKSTLLNRSFCFVKKSRLFLLESVF